MQHHFIKPDDPAQSPESIEARLDRDRAALSASLNALRERLAPDALWADGVALVSQNAPSYTKVLDHAIRTNPLALAVTAIGLAWLVLGRQKPAQREMAALAGTEFEAMSRWEDEGGPLADRVLTDDSWMVAADELRAHADRLFGDINAAERRRQLAAEELADLRADVLAALTADVRRVMAHGLEGLNMSDRGRICAARERAYVLRLRDDPNTHGRPWARPVEVGLASLGAGMAAAMMIPQSPAESQLLGTPRDMLLDAFNGFLRGERQRFAEVLHRSANSLYADASRPNAAHRDDPAGSEHD